MKISNLVVSAAVSVSGVLGLITYPGYSNPLGNGYYQRTNPLGNGYVQDSNPLGNGYVQDTNPLGNGYVQDKSVFGFWVWFVCD